MEGLTARLPDTDTAVIQTPGGPAYLVWLTARTYTCTEVQENGIPCVHALAFLHQKGVQTGSFLLAQCSHPAVSDGYCYRICPIGLIDLMQTPVEPPPVNETTGRNTII